MKPDIPQVCISRDDVFFYLHQAVTDEEAKLFRDSENIVVSFNQLEIIFHARNVSHIQATRLDTSNCHVETKTPGFWRAWDSLQFVFGFPIISGHY